MHEQGKGRRVTSPDDLSPTYPGLAPPTLIRTVQRCPCQEDNEMQRKEVGDAGFGHDFSRIRIFSDAGPAQASREGTDAAEDRTPHDTLRGGA